MGKEQVSKRQALFLMILFIFGSTIALGASAEAEQDSWMSILLAAIAVIPIAMVYARIIRLFPGQDLFALLETLFGKIFGKVFIALMSWYAFHLAALVVRDFSEFIQIVSMPETPQLPIMIAMILVIAYISKSGIETIGRLSLAILPVILFVVVITIILALPKMDFANILPFMEHDFGSIAAGAFSIFAFPFAEIIVLLGVAGAIKKEASPYKIFFKAILIAAAVLAVINIRNIEILGTANVSARYFPSYAAVRVIEIGDFMTRMEGVISVNYILAGLVKISLCLLAASKGVTSLFGLSDYRRIVMPVGISVVALSAVLYNNTMQMYNFLPVYQYYAIPFQIILPLIIWIAAEVKAKKQKSNAQPPVKDVV